MFFQNRSMFIDDHIHPASWISEFRGFSASWLTFDLSINETITNIATSSIISHNNKLSITYFWSMVYFSLSQVALFVHYLPSLWRGVKSSERFALSSVMKK